jgi:hypothetical protein
MKLRSQENYELLILSPSKVPRFGPKNHIVAVNIRLSNCPIMFEEYDAFHFGCKIHSSHHTAQWL